VLQFVLESALELIQIQTEFWLSAVMTETLKELKQYKNYLMYFVDIQFNQPIDSLSWKNLIRYAY
jgi:hypothetical protein